MDAVTTAKHRNPISDDGHQPNRPIPPARPTPPPPPPKKPLGRFDADIEVVGPAELKDAFARLARRYTETATPPSSPR